MLLCPKQIGKQTHKTVNQRPPRGPLGLAVKQVQGECLPNWFRLLPLFLSRISERDATCLDPTLECFELTRSKLT